MLEISNGMPGQEMDANVLFSGQIVLGPDQQRFRYLGEEGIHIEFDFRPRSSSASAPRVQTESAGNSYRLLLSNFGDTLGMAASGKISAVRPIGQMPIKAGAWQLRYNLVVQLIGEPTRPTRLVTFTLAEVRVA